MAYLEASQTFCVCIRDGGTRAQSPAASVVSVDGDGGDGGGGGGGGGGVATTVSAELGLTVVQANIDTKPTRG